jgi:hypothetical protein
LIQAKRVSRTGWLDVYIINMIFMKAIIPKGME